MMGASDPLFVHQSDYSLQGRTNHRILERPRPQRFGGHIGANDDAPQQGLRDIPFRLTTVARPPRTASGVPRSRSHQ